MIVLFHILVIVYFATAFFIAGYSSNGVSVLEVVKNIGISLFWLPLLIYYFLQEAGSYIASYFQLRFLYQYYFGHHYDDQDRNALGDLRKGLSKIRKEKTLRNRIFEMCVVMLLRKYSDVPIKGDKVRVKEGELAGSVYKVDDILQHGDGEWMAESKCWSMCQPLSNLEKVRKQTKVTHR